MKKREEYILRFNQIGIDDIELVGGKNASLGEMYINLTEKGVKVPDGFAITAKAYSYFLEKAKLTNKIKKILSDLDTYHLESLQQKGKQIRELIENSELPNDLKEAIKKAYKELCKEYGKEDLDVAVRSSATAEDLPDASFAGQQESYLNIQGEEQLINACKKCFASLFTDRAISYRVDKGFDHFSVKLSIGVQKMVRSDKASSGVIFTIDPETGFKDAIFITSAYGLGENIVQGAVNPDEYYVFKPTLNDYKAILSKKLGSKKIKMVYDEEETKNVEVLKKEQRKHSLKEEEILKLAKWACIIEDHYSKKSGKHKAMDIEWGKDGIDNELYILQARPETVHSQKQQNTLKKYMMKEKGNVLTTGRSVGDKIGTGQARVIKSTDDIHKFQKGEVLVAEMTVPDWEPLMKIASAIVTNKGGRTCFTGDNLLLTNKGFMTFKEVFNHHEHKGHEILQVPSLNKKNLKIEWKPVLAAMKRKGEAISIEVSQTGRMKGNTLKLTKDHKMLTFEGDNLIQKEIQKIIEDNEMLLSAQKLPRLVDSSEKERKLAYLLGAISTDGHVYLTERHGEVTFIQKPTKEKKKFIEKVEDCMFSSYGKRFKTTKKNKSTGLVRGKPCIGEANAYRLYSKQIATLVKEEQQKLVKNLLIADEGFIFNFLAGVIDGEGSCTRESSRIHIYCSNDNLLKSIVVGCLRLGINPQVTKNRNIHHIQIVERIEEIFKYTKRVRYASKRTKFGTRFFSAKQLFKNKNPGKFAQYINSNLLIDAEKIKGIKEFEKILNSDTRMLRANLVKEMGVQDVYNITVADNHNYIVFTSKLTPIIANNCHAAIISREFGVPCLVGTNDATEKIKEGRSITVDCSKGDEGYVFEGALKYDIETINLEKLPETKTSIMMNVGIPEQAFTASCIPNEGVGLARLEFIINSNIRIHPLALINYEKLDKRLKNKIASLTLGYKDKKQYFIDKLSQGVAIIAAAFYPKDVIVRLSDFKTNEYANLIGGKLYEPKEENPMIGWRGASRYYSGKYRKAFALECIALKKVREEMGLKNVKVMVPFVRTVEEGKAVIKEMNENGLKQGVNDLEIYMMCEIPSNVILAEKFLDIFDGYSIGTNDLTQLTLGLDRDSELVSSLYDERNEAVKKLISDVVKIAKKKGKKIGICGEGPSTFPDFAKFLVDCGIDSMSLTPDAVIKTMLKISKED